MGAVWWLIKDAICLPHGHDTLHRHHMAYGLMGGILAATIVNPVNFVYGFLAGLVFGHVKVQMNLKSLPRGMEWKLK